MTRKCKLKTCRSPLPAMKDCTTAYQETGFCDADCSRVWNAEKRQEYAERKKAREAVKPRAARVTAKPRKKACRYCKERLVPSGTPIQDSFCCEAHKVQCAIEAGRKLVAKRKAQEDRAFRQRKREWKERTKTRRDWLKDAQAAFNSYIRARDAGLPCASCGSRPDQKMGGTMDCSHYRSVGAAPHMRFSVYNAAAACVRCNRELSGNVVELRKGLVARFGLEIVERIEQDETIRRFDIEWLRRFARIFRARARHVERLRERLRRAA